MVMAAGLVDDSGSPLLESLLEQPCSEQHLVLISTLIADWIAVAPYLELTQADEAAILVFSPHSLPGQTLTMLRTWCQRNGAAATYKRLSDALSHCGRQDLVDKIHELATTHREGAREEVSRRSAYNIITSNIPSPSDSTQITATSHNQFLSFTNQLSSRYPVTPNILPYNPFPPYFLPVQQPVLPPSYPQAYLSSYPYMLQQGNDLTHAHAPSEFSSPSNPVHLNKQYSLPPSHTNTPILHQNPSLSYEQYPLPSHSSGPLHPYHHRLSSQPFSLYSSTDPNSVTTAPATATSHHSINPSDMHSLTSQFSSMTTSPRMTTKHTWSGSTRLSHSMPYQSSRQQSFPPPHFKQTYTSYRDSTITAYHSLAPSSPPVTTHSGVTASLLTPVHHLLSPAMQRYVRYLKNVYKNKTTPVYDKEHSLLHVKAKSYINIALVHKDSPQYMNDSDRNELIMDRLHGHVDVIQETKTKLNIGEVCKLHDGKLARSVLVEGAPGVGKTTFAYELCKRWARGEILQEWTAVVFIKLRDHTTCTRTARNMYDLLYHPRPDVQQAVVDELIDDDGEYILLILDGYDELTDSQKQSTAVIQRIMSKELLVQATVIVTSRPLATRTLSYNFRLSKDQHIEVLGFTEKNIEEYIQSACGDKPELVKDFKSYLSSHPFSSALMFNPLQCAIVTDLYRSQWEKGDKGFAPKTLTELYTGLVHIMLVRYLTQHPVYEDRDWKIDNLSDLPKEVNEQLKAVTELAAKGIKNQEYVFDEVNTNIPSETLGLMQKEEVVASGSGISTSHNFLHLTLQEYLAAVNYSQQCSSPEQLSQLLTRDDLFPLNNFLQYYGMKRELTLNLSATHWPVVLFVAGRTKLSGVPTNIFKTGLHDSDYDDSKTTVDVSLLHLLYETQSPQLIQSTLVTSRKYLSVSGSSALDWFVIGYCIANSTSTWRVEKSGNDFHQLVMGLRLGPEECSGECKIASLHISGYWTENFKNLSNLQPYAKSVTEIKLVGNKQWEQCDLEKSTRTSEEVSACYSMLERFTIENVESSYSASLLSFISQHSNLQILSMNQCNLSSIATSSLIHFIQSPNNRLHKLTLHDCTIQIPDHTDSVAISYEMKSISPIDTENFSLEITGSLYAIHVILSQPHLFYANTLTILKVTIVSGTTADSLQTTLYPNLVTLKIVSVSKENAACLHSFPFSPHENNLCTLSLMRCHLSNKCVSSLIHFLQSPNNRLHQLKIDGCTIQIPDHINSAAILYHVGLISISDTGKFSLMITGSLNAINYMLSQPHLFYANTLTVLKVFIVSETTDSLQISLYPNLKTLEIVSKNTAYLHSFLFNSHENNLCTLSLMRCHLSVECVRSLIHLIQFPNNRLHELTLDDCTIQRDSPQISKIDIYTMLHDSVIVGSQQNNLHKLSLKRCNLTCDTVRSLIHSLQSSHCGLQELTLDDCTFDHTHTTTTSSKIKLKSLDSGNVSLEFTGYCCDISHWLSQLSSYTQLTEFVLHLKRQDSTADTLQEIVLYHHVLESFKISIDQSSVYCKCYAIPLPFSIPQFIGLQQNNLHNLSLKECNLSSDVTKSLIHSLQSPHCRLHKLTIFKCSISKPDEVQLQHNTISTKNNTTLCSLVSTNSMCVLNQIFSNFFFTQVTELSFRITTRSYLEAEVFTKIPCLCPMLETLKIDSSVRLSLPFSIPQFIGSQQNNLHTLLLRKCSLICDVTRSLIHSLQSPHCKIYKLALYDCTIVTDHTQLTTAIVSSTTITHLLFIDEDIDTPSLTALASGLKHNTTIEQLAVDKFTT